MKINEKTMDIPHPPKDTSLRNIIDKLAEFVARNGPEFEQITRVKQQNNPKFGFLNGGDFYDYYQWRVSNETAVLKQFHPNNSMGGQSGSVAGWNNVGSSNGSQTHLQAQIDAVTLQQTTLRDQIRQSEMNLSAQHEVLRQQQQSQIEEVIDKAQDEWIHKQAEELNVRFKEFESVLQPIIETCTKDSISAGKNWILQHTTDTPKSNVILQYLLKKALLHGASFSKKLHLIYLVNDVLHHCVRKRSEDLKNCLENIVIPMFCSAQIIADDAQKTKLTKLLSLWESKSNFFDACVISKLRSPASSMNEYKTNLMNTHSAAIATVSQSTKLTFENYKQQHQAFIQHASQQLALLENQRQSLIMEQQQQQQQSHIPTLDPTTINNGQQQQQQSVAPVPLMSQPVSMPDIHTGSTNNNFNSNRDSFHNSEGMFMNPSPPPTHMPSGTNDGNGRNGAAYQLPPPSFFIPDLSKPPPMFGPGSGSVSSNVLSNVMGGQAMLQPISEPEEIKPTVPYFELPAALMVPLIRLEDFNYKPLDPEDLRLPPPAPPSERLISAMEAFYSLPSHDRPRDGDGWEKLGLYEYYKVKNAARKTKEDELENGLRERSRSPTPIYLEVIAPICSNKRCYRSKSRSKSRSLSRSRSRSPPVTVDRRDGRRTVNRWSPKRRSLSPVRRQTPPLARRDRNAERAERNDRERQKERNQSLSPQPPNFATGNYGPSTNEAIEESNKGHQMLMKMGWAGSGTGLGAQGQGIDAPISGGEVRDKQDKFKGVGINLNDPYENFRKNKGAAFIHRMRSRDQDRKK